MSFHTVVVGGGLAGLSAALILGRARRNTLVVNFGNPRNQPVEHSHSFVTRDGENPLELLRIAREQLTTYPTVQFKDNFKVISCQKEATTNLFHLEVIPFNDTNTTTPTTTTTTITAQSVVFATGVKDVIPDTVPQFKQLWGKSVLACPYCHGFEVADSSFGVVSNGFPGFMVTQLLLSSWSKKVTFFSNGPLDLPEPQKQRLLSLGAVFHEEKIQKLSANGDKLEAVVLESGASVPIDYLFAHFPSVPLINEIAFKDMETPIVVNHDPKDVMMKGQTNVPGVYIAGDLVSMFHQLSHAAYTGTLAGALANNYLATL